VTEDVDRDIAESVFRRDPKPPQFLVSMSKMLSPREFWTTDDDQIFYRKFARVKLMSSQGHNDKNLLQQWINDTAARKGALEYYHDRFFRSSTEEGSSETAIDWDDLRIRELNDEETSRISRWMSLSSAYVGYNYLNERLTKMHLTIGDLGAADRKADQESTSREMLADAREKHKPTWLKEWERQAESSSKTAEQEEKKEG